jgi:hypothetical protein
MSAIMLSFSMSAAFAHDTPSTEKYWQNGSFVVCYINGELDDLSMDGSTGKEVEFKNEFNDSLDHYDAQSEFSLSVTTTSVSTVGSCASSNVAQVGKYNDGWYGNLAEVTYSSYISGTDYYYKKTLDYNTEKDFGEESNTCNWDDWDPEWTMNHEFGHILGLMHHDHWPYADNSVMDHYCNSEWASLGQDDKDTLDNYY